jgi:RNA polymerase sigma-70 factor (ECF subfamily)
MAASEHQAQELNELLSRCALGDQRAFAVLYRLTAPKLYGVTLRILRRSDWAEEVLQESFVNIWSHAGAYAQAKSAPMTWMTSIVRNRSLDWLRRPRREQVDDNYDALLDTLQDDKAGPMEQLLQSNDAALLARCLQRLEDPQRQSILLAYFHGLTHAELARHLKQPLGSVKTWIRRGLEKLKVCLSAT